MLSERDQFELFQFFGTFHQDYIIDAPNAEGIITNYIELELEPAKLSRLADLIDLYERSIPNDDALTESLFGDLCCYYMPSSDGLTTRGWLRHVSSRLRSAANG